jgi:membrane-bound lytic murein transglycosylase MltF
MSYSQTSPYYNTSVYANEFLDLMSNRPITTLVTDTHWEITATYHLRPDLLAFDLYQDSKLWWVFAQRNPNTLKDPLYDFTAGTSIYLPEFNTLQEDLGL